MKHGFSSHFCQNCLTSNSCWNLPSSSIHEAHGVLKMGGCQTRRPLELPNDWTRTSQVHTRNRVAQEISKHATPEATNLNLDNNRFIARSSMSQESVSRYLWRPNHDWWSPRRRPRNKSVWTKICHYQSHKAIKFLGVIKLGRFYSLSFTQAQTIQDQKSPN